jgi:uncharacterized protein YegL
MVRSNIFISYSRQDENILRRLLRYLELLQRENTVKIWTDAELKGGDRWHEEIEAALDTAAVAVLLISQEFLASPFICQEELPRILRRQSEGKLTVLPVYLSPSTVSSARISFIDRGGIKRQAVLSEFQGIGTPDRTIRDLKPSQRDRRYLKLHDRIKELVGSEPLTAGLINPVSGIGAQPLSRVDGPETSSKATLGGRRRLPIYILVDCSSSMVGDPIESVNVGFRSLQSNLMDDPSAIETVYLSVITFASTAQQIIPMTEVSLFAPPDLTAGGKRCFGAALKLLIECTGREVRRSSPDTEGDWKPIIFMLTDGEPTDPWQEYADILKRNPPGDIIAFACGGAANPTVLRSITNTVLIMNDVSP